MQVKYINLGVIAYQDALRIQEKLMQTNIDHKKNKQSCETQHYLLICEHPPVYTLGKNGKLANLLIHKSQLEAKKIDFFHTTRGGDITFHGPGQLVAYPILDLDKVFTDIGKYLRTLEQIIIDTLDIFAILGERSEKETGVWINPQDIKKARKICAMGIKLSRWVSMHGLALNVNTNLDYFNDIIPCGISNKSVTSISEERDKTTTVKEVIPSFLNAFSSRFSCSVYETHLDKLS